MGHKCGFHFSRKLLKPGRSDLISVTLLSLTSAPFHCEDKINIKILRIKPDRNTKHFYGPHQCLWSTNMFQDDRKHDRKQSLKLLSYRLGPPPRMTNSFQFSFSVTIGEDGWVDYKAVMDVLTWEIPGFRAPDKLLCDKKMKRNDVRSYV